MSDPYLWLKWLHVVSAAVLFGTGLGTALQMWLAHLRRDPRAIAVVARNVVLVDWLFTASSGVIQPLSGFGLVTLAGFDPWSSWLVISYGLYALAALCWFRVVWLQIRVRDIAAAAVAEGREHEGGDQDRQVLQQGSERVRPERRLGHAESQGVA